MVIAHGSMKTPRERGSLNNDLMGSFEIDDIPIDSCHHCNNGGGVGSTKNHINGDWMEWDPLNMFAPFRRDAGLCGDPIDESTPRAHEKGGKYGPPETMPYSAVYKMGQTVTFDIMMSTNHIGYFSYYVCNVLKCDGDVSEKCFREGYCRQLFRATEPECESASSTRCSPIDPAFPGRWYVPQGLVGTMSMKYKLPAGFKCRDCVVIWYWATSNTCYEKGVQEYFLNYPKYNKKAQENMGRCRTKIPEEFWNCADVRITGPGVSPPAIMPPILHSFQKYDDFSEKNNSLKYGSNFKYHEKAHKLGYQKEKSVNPKMETPRPVLVAKSNLSAYESSKDRRIHPYNNLEVGKRIAKPVQHENNSYNNSNLICRKAWKPCGGKEYRGSTICCAQLKCVVLNEYYSQCQHI